MAPDIFLSYAREDVSKATELARILKVAGWSVWWDKEIVAGRDFELEIDAALSEAKAVLVLWSSYSISSNWVRSEAKEAKEANKLIPVLLDDSRIPLSFRSLSTIELRDWPNKASLLELGSLKSAISRLLKNEYGIQSIKEPDSSYDMTLSLRVATRVAEMVGQQSYAEPESQNSRLLIERCITDICVDLLTGLNDDREINLHPHLIGLGEALNANSVIIAHVDFDKMSVISTQSPDGAPVSAESEKLVMRYVNDYCSSSDELNLDLSSDSWLEQSFFCVPLAPEISERKFAWYLVGENNAKWRAEIQKRLLKISFALQKVGEHQR